MASPYNFIKQGRLFVQPVSMGAEVPYFVQPITKPRDFSLWVRGRIEEPTFQLDNVRMPPSMFQEVRNDLVRYSPVEVSRSAFCRSNHAYTGVIDSKGTPYYFALDGRGISVREAKASDDQVWKTFDRLADQEREMATGKRRIAADAEVRQIDRELSRPQFVITKGAPPENRIGSGKRGFPTHKQDGTPIKKPSLYQKLRGLAGKPRTDITDTGSDAPVMPKMKLLTKAEVHTGTMVALHIPREIAEKIALPDGESVESMHITLAYLGKDLTEEQKSGALVAVRRFAQQSGPIRALLGGVGRFSASHTSEGNDVVYLSVDSPDITRLRPKLLEELAAEGVEPSNAHGFVPHVTLMYVATTARTPIKRFPPLAVEFASVSLTVADIKMQLPFTTTPSMVKALTFHQAPDGKGAHSDDTHHGTYEVHSKPKTLGIGKKHVLMYYPFKGDTHSKKLSTHSTIADAHAAAETHHQKQSITSKALYIIKALPKKAKEEKTKKTPTKGASKKQVGAGGKTRYTYPSEKLGAGKGKPKAGQQQPLLIVRHDDSKNANPSELANQLGVSVRTLQRAAKRLGRDGFAKFMRSRLKRFSAKHRIDPDYWGTLHEKLMGST